MILESETAAAQRENEGGDQGPLGSGGSSEINVGSSERLGSVLGGSLLTMLGLRSRSTFGALMAVIGGGLIYRGVTGHCPVYERLGKNTAMEPAPSPEEYFEHGVHVQQVETIDKPAEELYRFWRNLENLPRFMDHLESVKALDDRRSYWVAKGPAGIGVEWYAEIINDEPNRLIAWRSVDGADVPNTGSVRFLPAADGRGTEVHVTMEYLPPGGELGRWAAKLFGEAPEQQVSEDLKKLKVCMDEGASGKK